MNYTLVLHQRRHFSKHQTKEAVHCHEKPQETQAGYVAKTNKELDSTSESYVLPGAMWIWVGVCRVLCQSYSNCAESPPIHIAPPRIRLGPTNRIAPVRLAGRVNMFHRNATPLPNMKREQARWAGWAAEPGRGLVHWG